MPIDGPALDAPFPLTDLLSVGLEYGPDRKAIITRDETLTWAELEIQSERLAKN